MSRILVTGSEGFAGKHLTSHLLDEGHDVVGLSRSHRPSNVNISDHYQVDMLDYGAVAGIHLEEFDAVIHTAANASQKDSFSRPGKFIFENQNTTFNLLEAGRLRNALGRFVIVSTASVYSGKNTIPITEQSLVGDPKSPYAIGKINAESIVSYYIHEGVDAVLARPFNHTGPGQSTGYLLPDLYMEVSEAMNNGRVAKFGNLDAKRDFTDVRDVVRAYGMLATENSLQSRIYNISSGQALPGTLVLSLLAEKMGYDLPEDVETDESLSRKNEATILIGDNSRIVNELGWRPEIDIKTTVSDFVDFKEGIK